MPVRLPEKLKNENKIAAKYHINNVALRKPLMTERISPFSCSIQLPRTLPQPKEFYAGRFPNIE